MINFNVIPSITPIGEEKDLVFMILYKNYRKDCLFADDNTLIQQHSRCLVRSLKNVTQLPYLFIIIEELRW